MTKKLNPLEDPPTASSSDDDDVETSEAGEASDDSSSSEEEQPIKAPIKTPSATTTIAAAPPKSTTVSTAAADSDSGSETETDSDSESTNPPNSGSGKTIAVSAVNLKKKEDPTSSAALALPAVKSGTKRPASEATTTTSTKRVKKDEESIKKPGAFQRLWSEEDEISVLQGMIDFKADTGKSPYEDTNVFYEFLKKSISFEVSKNQFMDKIRSLRKKYIGKEGKEPSFVKAHDKKAFELSKFIWGPKGIARDSNVKSNGVSKKSAKKKKIDSVKQELVFVGGDSSTTNGKKVEDVGGDDKEVLVHGGDWFDNSSLVRMIAGLGVDEYYVKQQWSLVPVETKKMIEEKFKLLQAKELEFVLEKTKFLQEVTSMIVEASKKSH
ncbi:GLABROUS1 enhancer-binding protein family [Arabidopsis thaliana x Arabidopsis arenosa]|uniref:GLABROUS1 enhancer-binding protein family n=1 Tax=Arabidopsis thaliana x Arabidopsis arenosa TaxID=1240361 RepID=A0A8T2BCN0_9BRAS|nr:GLABROUS1 enhancer-binding protein family [Arabidopsis thaliana x Arabidopsis arenosa]